MRLNCPLCLTGCHWYTNTPSIRQAGKITSGGPRVFLSLHPPSSLSNHLSAPTVRIKTNPPFFLLKKPILIMHEEEFKIASLFVVWGKGFDSQTGRCTCVLCFCAVVSALCELKEAVDHSLETQTVCAVQWTFSISWHQRTNVQCILCVCARVRVCVWTCESALLEGKCLMGSWSFG